MRMKLNDGYYYVILCEDRQTQEFIRHFLAHQGIRRVRAVPVPGRQGSGEEFVRLMLPNELRELKRKKYNRRALIVCTDADNLNIEDRRKKLFSDVDDELIYCPLMLLWIPKHQIETWIYELKGIDNIDEDTIYRHNKPIRCRRESEKMSVMFQNGGDKIRLPSMKAAYKEYEVFCKNQV